jgi:DNA-binding MarR family transcriptional regulator
LPLEEKERDQQRRHRDQRAGDRLMREGLVAHEPSSLDRRKVELRLTLRGRQVLAKLAAVHRAELQRIGPILKRFFAELSRRPNGE